MIPTIKWNSIQICRRKKVREWWWKLSILLTNTFPLNYCKRRKIPKKIQFWSIFVAYRMFEFLIIWIFITSYQGGRGLGRRLLTRGGFRGGGGGRPLLQGFDSLPTKGSPLCTISRYPYLVTDPKNFLNIYLLWRTLNIYLLWGGSARQKKCIFLVKIFQKVPKNAFLCRPVFQDFACGAKNFTKTGFFQCFGRARKINSVDLKKRSTKFFWKSALPSRKS